MQEEFEFDGGYLELTKEADRLRVLIRERVVERLIQTQTSTGMRSGVCWKIGSMRIKKYIESQRWDEEGEGFKITAPTKP